MACREIPNKLTPLPEKGFILVAAKAWAQFYNKGPEARQLTCCLAQMVLESARKKVNGEWLWGTSAHNYNWGNIKSADGDLRSWQYYWCGEELALSVASAERTKHPDQIQILRQYKNAAGKDLASVKILPPHPWCRFRAFDTALEGTLDYLSFLAHKTRYLDAWNLGVMKGDPAIFAKELGNHGYYTASIPVYTRLVVSLFNEFQPKVVEVLKSPEGQQVYAEEREEEAERLSGLMKDMTSRVMHQQILAAINGELDNDKSLTEDELRATITPNVVV